MIRIRISAKLMKQILAAQTLDESWRILCASECNVPILAGGIDHFKHTTRRFYVFDRGCNNKDNSFCVEART